MSNDDKIAEMQIAVSELADAYDGKEKIVFNEDGSIVVTITYPAKSFRQGK